MAGWLLVEKLPAEAEALLNTRRVVEFRKIPAGEVVRVLLQEVPHIDSEGGIKVDKFILISYPMDNCRSRGISPV
ncbi:hypothetical protein [Halobacillus litoralis]|uniref:Uncharacterized protein n=1 Tax=Halobacillus litoralis TaxID=45668 RepID=A0A410MA70_9BACI|nr:hypothetical protein [Halobacillus litoralis]QAS51619.1 hypothetical protein HLI_04935 [Halobacillus litoralis]